MRRLLPTAADDVDLVEAYRPPVEASGARAFVRANMISTLDGAVTLNGSSGMLGGPADRRVFQALRSLADVVLVGAGTARAEHYGPARLDEHQRAERAARGQPPVPPIAIVTQTASVDWTDPFFTEAEERPIIFTTGAQAGATRRDGAGLAEVVAAGGERVEIPAVVGHLAAAGYRSILLEGGPGINAQVVAAGLLDELCLTISPRLVGGDGPRVLTGPELVPPLALGVVHLLEEDGFFFCRLTVGPRSPTGATLA